MLFDSTLRRDLARSFAATLVVILTIVITMMLIRTLGLAANGKVAPQDVVLLLTYTALSHLPTMLSLSLFIATVATLTRMYRDSEMVIWFTSGVSLSRFVRPVLRLGWPVLTLVMLLVLFVWPWVNQHSAALKERYERRSDLSRIVPGQFQTSRDGRRVFFIDRDSQDNRNGRNAFILTRDANHESVVSARSGRIEEQGDRRFIVLEQGQRNEVNLATREKTVSRFASYSVLAGERALSNVDDPPEKTLPSVELLLHPVPRYQGELTWRLGLVMGAANLLLLAIGLSATNPRRTGNWSLLFALLSFVVYYNLINLSKAWVAGGKASMGGVLLATHGSAFLLALALLWWRTYARNLGHLRWPRMNA
ncbi:MAG: LPS export ABC transporter permease LptF [Burkholderiaceae bacterium]|nr:LPS export ABC transporter permease LptF [Burkholderiaceae bacterium]MDH3460236.1 LPS export ABC transporter permease LptF [Burkholderiaceae bacterium]